MKDNILKHLESGVKFDNMGGMIFTNSNSHVLNIAEIRGCGGNSTYV